VTAVFDVPGSNPNVASLVGINFKHGLNIVV
jgi:hypothetical protein